MNAYPHNRTVVVPRGKFPIEISIVVTDRVTRNTFQFDR